MIQRFKQFVLALTLLFSTSMVLVPVVANANAASDACAGVTALDSSASCSGKDSGKGIDNILKWVLNIFSAIVGFIAVLMVIIGGVKFITSNGDSSNVASAKNTIIYALVGLVIVAMAQIIVHFVLHQASGAIK